MTVSHHASTPLVIVSDLVPVSVCQSMSRDLDLAVSSLTHTRLDTYLTYLELLLPRSCVMSLFDLYTSNSDLIYNIFMKIQRSIIKSDKWDSAGDVN